MWVRFAVSVLLVVAAVALPGLKVSAFAPVTLADTFLPAKALAAPAVRQPAVPGAFPAKAQNTPSSMMGMMGVSTPMSDTMPMQNICQMMPMDMQDMGWMMQMMGMMMQMMGMMHGMGMVAATEPTTGTMPMMSGEIGMMGQMMGMMSQMQGMMGSGMMVGGMGMMGGTAPAVPVTTTVPITEGVPATAAPPATGLLSQTLQVGAVAVTVQPRNLGAPEGDRLDFEVTLETHSGSLEQDLGKLAVLRIGDVEVPASGWDAPSGGHHVEGILSFPALNANGKPILVGATELSLTFHDLAGAGDQVLTWSLAGSEAEESSNGLRTIAPLAEATLPFDAQFIDSMIEHHLGAIAMAEQAQVQAEHAEVRELADAIVAAQTDEIAQMGAWRGTWYPDLSPTGGMSMEMGEMTFSAETDLPFDQRFIEAMISHHQGAIEMATEAQTKAEHTEIKDLADAIITAQQAEIEQMQGWLRAWYE